MKILVTGASGFIGSHVAVGLAAQGHRVVAVRGSNPSPSAVSGVCEVVQVDLRERDAVRSLLAAQAPEAIVHAAALTSTGACEADPHLARATNVTATENLVTAAMKTPASVRPLFIYFSTDLVYDGGNPPANGFSEADAACPLSVYGHSKLAAEMLVRIYSGPSIVLRTALTYGPPIGPHQGFLGWMRASLEAGKKLQLFHDEWRTPVHTEDIVRTISSLLNPVTKVQYPELFHLAGPERITRLAFGERLAEVFGYDTSLLEGVSLNDVTTPAPRAKDASLRIDKLHRRLQIAPLSVAAGLMQIKDCASDISSS